MTTEIKCFDSIPGAPKAVGPYSPAVRVGNMVYLSGQVGLNPESSQLVGTDIESQTEQVLNNLKTVLAGVGLSFKHVVKSVIFLTDLSHFQTVNKIYGERLEGHKPARSTIQVSALPLGAIVEIEMIAVAE
jgi:2-iminobutanoate/2-iminopropanoate deaminase